MGFVGRHSIHPKLIKSAILTCVTTAQGLGLVRTRRQVAGQTCGGPCYLALDSTWADELSPFAGNQTEPHCSAWPLTFKYHAPFVDNRIVSPTSIPSIDHSTSHITRPATAASSSSPFDHTQYAKRYGHHNHACTICSVCRWAESNLLCLMLTPSIPPTF